MFLFVELQIRTQESMLKNILLFISFYEMQIVEYHHVQTQAIFAAKIHITCSKWSFKKIKLSLIVLDRKVQCSKPWINNILRII